MYRHRQIYIVWMVTDCLMGRLGLEPILSIKQSVSIGTMINFDSDCDGLGDGTCKQALVPPTEFGDNEHKQALNWNELCNITRVITGTQ